MWDKIFLFHSCAFYQIMPPLKLMRIRKKKEKNKNVVCLFFTLYQVDRATIFNLWTVNSTFVDGFSINQSAESRERRMFIFGQIEISKKHEFIICRTNCLAFRPSRLQ